MSGTQVSTFADPNILLRTLSGQQTADVVAQQQANQLNALLQPYKVQEAQQQVAGNEMDAMGRASLGLLNLPDEASRAAAYPGVVADLQKLGYAKNAPSQYPGEGVLRGLVSQAVPVAQQYQYGMVSNPELLKQLQQIYQGNTTGTVPGAGGGGGAGTTTYGIPARGTGGPGSSTEMPPELLPYFREASQTYNIPMDLLIAQARQESGFRMIPGSSGEIGIMQIMPSTARGMGIDPATLNDPRQNILAGARYLRERAGANADMNNPAVQAAALHAYNGGGDPNYVANVFRYRPGLAPGAPETKVATYQLPVSGPQTAPVPQVAGAQQPAPTQPPGGATTPPPYRVAGAIQPPPSAPTTPAGGTSSAATLPAPPPAPQPNALAPPPPAPQQPAPGAQMQPPQSRASLPRAADVPSGMQAPQVQQAQSMISRAAQLEVVASQAPPNSPAQRAAKAMADDLRTRAQVLMQSDSVVQTQEGQLHTLTGKIDDPTKPLANYVWDPNAGGGVGGYVDTTQTNKPEFAPAQRDAAVAQKDVMELGPLVANGTATPEQKARYDVAVETYRQPTLRENPITKETVKVYQRDLPPGFPQSSSAVGAGGGGQGSGGQVVIPGYSPKQAAIERDPAAYKVAVNNYDSDFKEMPAITDTVKAAQQDQIRIAEMQSVLNDLNTGPGRSGIEHAKAWLQANLPSAVNPFSEQTQNLSGPAAAEIFTKLAFKGSVAQERQSSSRGGYAVTKLFQQLNPGMDLLNPSNKSLLNTQLISNQADIDYGTAANQFFLDQEKQFQNTGKYDSQRTFEQQWISQRNPQVYNAAIMALNGQPVEVWAKGLSREGGQNSEYARALAIIGRAKPGTVVNADSGRIVVGPQAAATPPPPPGFKVVQ